MQELLMSEKTDQIAHLKMKYNSQEHATYNVVKAWEGFQLMILVHDSNVLYISAFSNTVNHGRYYGRW